jgi:excisionase family DNA binding protein
MKVTKATRHTQPLMVNIQQAGELLSISPHTIRSHIKRGLIPHVKIGRRLLVPMRDLEALSHPVQIEKPAPTDMDTRRAVATPV